jgi:SNF2 family DNA or RNA helicase
MTQMFRHQAECVAQYWDRKSFGLFWEMGTGKTLVLIEQAKQLFHNQYIKGIVVIAPSEVYLNWLKQIKEHAPGFSVVAWSSKSISKSEKNIEWLINQAPHGLKVLVINVEALGRDKPPALFQALYFIKAMGKILLTVDESSCIKNPKAKSVKNVMSLSRYCQYRRALNGTPGVEKPFDVWQQLEFLSPGCTGYNHFMFTKTYGVWQRQYFGPRSFDKCVGYRNIDQIKHLLEKHGQFIKKEDCVDLPPKLYETYEFDLPPPVMSAYNEVKRRRIIEVSDKLLTFESAMTLAIQLHNIATGFIRHDDKMVEWVTRARANALLSLLEGIEGKAVIFCNSRPGLIKLAEEVGSVYGPKSYRLVYGDVDIGERVNYIDEFQNDPNVRFFIANQQTAGRGVTLTAASYVIYFRNGYSLEERLQSEDRTHRIGQNKSVTIIDIIARNTIDERIVSLLKDKKDVASQLLGLVQQEVEEQPF